MRYQSNQLEQVVDQITEQFEQIMESPEMLKDSLDLVAYTEIKDHLGSIGYDKEFIQGFVGSSKIDLEGSGLVKEDVRKACREMCDVMDKAFSMLKYHIDPEMAEIAMQGSGITLEFN